MVRRCLQPRRWRSCAQSRDSNCHPRSVVMADGTPNRAIHPVVKVRATVSAVISAMGNASGHRVKRLMQVNR